MRGLAALVCLLAMTGGGCADARPQGETGESAPAALESSFVPSAAGRPVLLVTIDTLRWDALGSYGADTETATLDALAARGVRFEHAVAHAVVTLPSHASILTGLDPSRHGIHDNDGYRLEGEAFTWAERLKEAGYATGAFVAAFPLDSLFGLAQGFDLYDDYYGTGGGTGASLQITERRAEPVVASALDWIEGRDGPWFAWVHVYDPHAPYGAPPPFGIEHSADPYAGEVAYVDAMLAPLMDEAAAREAIVVVTSDHGEGLGDHGEETHGVLAYASTLRVPLIMAGLPGVETGVVVPERVRHIDVLPTVLATLGLGTEGVQGVTLHGVIEGAVHPETTSYFEALTPYLDWGWAPLRGLYEGPLKFIDVPLPELYDVRSDPGETRNLIDRRAATAERLRVRLEEHLAEGSGAATEPEEEDPETLRRLRALGYLGSSGRSRTEGEEFGPEDDPKRLVPMVAELQRAARSLEDGRPAAAASILRSLIEQRPDFARAWAVLAEARDRQSGPRAAVRVLEEARQQGAATPFLLGRLGYFYQQAGRLPEAARTVEEALEARPDDAEMIAQLATIRAQAGQPGQAERLLERALAIDPTYARLHANRGTLMLQTGRLDGAEQAFRQALEYDDSLAEAHNGLGVIASQRDGDPSRAVEHWRKALAAEPDQPFVLYNLGLTLMKLERYAEAIEALDRYVQLAPDDAEARRLLEGLRRDQGL